MKGISGHSEKFQHCSNLIHVVLYDYLDNCRKFWHQMISTLSQVFHYVCRGRWLVNEPSMLRQQRFEISRSVLTPTWRLDAICSSLQNDRIYLGFFLNERSTPQVTGKISAFPWKSRNEAPQRLQKFRYHICSSACTNLLESETYLSHS